MTQPLFTAMQVLHRNVMGIPRIRNALPLPTAVSPAPRKCKRRFPVVSPIDYELLDNRSSIFRPKSLAVIPTLLAPPFWILLVITSVPALAQPGSELNRATLAISVSEEDVRTKATEWHTQCMRDWDQQTHMTKEEWLRACQRTVDERVQWLRGQVKGASQHHTSPRG